MLNLLRPEQKKKIIREYHMRFFVLALALLFVAQIIAMVLLLPSYVILKSRADDLNYKNSISQAQSLSQEGTSLNAMIGKTNDYVSIFLSTSTPKNVSAAIHEVVDNKGSAVRINGLVYSVQAGKQQIIAQGIANSRQDLLDFIGKIKQQPGVVSADLPISDFSQAQDINFSITITIVPNNS